MPKVSVIIATYNRTHFVCEAIESVLNQTFPDFEIIVIDDGSIDNTKQVLEKYASRIQYIFQENKGRAEARNTGIKNAKCEYIAFLDDDDIWLPNKLEKQVIFLDSHPDIELVYTFTEVINEQGRLLEEETKNHLKLYKKAMKIGYTDEGGSRQVVRVQATFIGRNNCFDKFMNWIKENKEYLIGAFLTILFFGILYIIIWGGQLEMRDCIKETHDMDQCSFGDRDSGW